MRLRFVPPARPLLLAASMLAGVLLTSAIASADTAIGIVDQPRPIQQWGFGPRTARVQPGAWVVWSNSGSDTHSVTAVDESFDSGPLAPGEGFSWYFDQPGTYDYVCSVHPWMTGRVVVEDGSAAPADTGDSAEGSR